MIWLVITIPGTAIVAENMFPPGTDTLNADGESPETNGR